MYDGKRRGRVVVGFVLLDNQIVRVHHGKNPDHTGKPRGLEVGRYARCETRLERRHETSRTERHSSVTWQRVLTFWEMRCGW